MAQDEKSRDSQISRWDHKCDTAIQSTVAKTFHHDVNPMVAIEQNKINELYRP